MVNTMGREAAGKKYITISARRTAVSLAAGLIMTFGSFIAFFLMKYDEGISIFFGMIAVPVAFVFFGIVTIRLLFIVLGNKVLMTIDDEGIVDRKGNRINYNEIENVIFLFLIFKCVRQIKITRIERNAGSSKSSPKQNFSSKNEMKAGDKQAR